MQIDLRKLAQVVAVARTGSFSRAARELHITQPALSRNIAAVETELGVKIFERGRNGASLTKTGALAVEGATALLQQAEGLAHQLALLGSGDAGQLSFGLGPMLGSLLLPGLSRRFLAERPQLQLRAVSRTALELQRALLDDQIELFYAGTGQLAPSPLLQLEHIVRLPIAYVVRASHPLAGKRRLSNVQLLVYPMLAGAELPQGRAGNGGLVCDNYQVLREATLHSDGIWITSPLMVREELASGEMCELRIDPGERINYTDIGRVSRAGFAPSPGARHLHRYVLEVLRP